MKQYLELMADIKKSGLDKEDRTGVGTRGVFGRQMRFDLKKGFPLVTTKKIHVKSVIIELLWFLSGSTNVRFLQENDCKIWNEWADAEGNLGPVYGRQWRSWPTPEGTYIDQITQLVHDIKTNPASRRLLVVAWNPGELHKMALPPCHCLFQFFVGNGTLSCQLYQRSCDVFLGLPFNIASYALLTHMIAQQCDLDVGEFIWTGGDTHLYKNHLDFADMQLERLPKILPTLHLRRRPEDLFSYRYEDFEIRDYDPWPHIKAPVAV